MFNKSVSLNNLPSIHRGRSKLNLVYPHKGTTNLGTLRVLAWNWMVPGDTYKISETKVIRTQPMVSAPMDDLKYDTYHFVMDVRDLWESFPKFIGESTSKWRDLDVEKIMPKINSGENGFELGSIADDMGLPIGVADLDVNAIPFRMYAAIVNHWFRSTVVEDEIYVPTDDADQDYMPLSTEDPVNMYANGCPYQVNRNVDAFSIASVEPQRGVAVSINLAGDVPVFGNGVALGLTDSTNFAGLTRKQTDNYYYAGLKSSNFGADIGSNGEYVGNELSATAIGVPTKEQLENHDASYTGLVADLSGAGVITINELRNAFAIQQYYEALSLYGNRYNEIIQALFGVVTSDRALHKPEFIGGRETPIQIFSSVQSSETGLITPQGNVVGYSVTGDDSYIGEYTADDYKIYMCVGVPRIAHHTYSQGVSRDFLVESFTDLYNPLFDNLGDDKILKKELYCDGTATDEEVFGYQERWYNFRYGHSVISGNMRPGLGASSLPWNFTDNYLTHPNLSRDWMKEDKALLDRCLAVTSANADQFFFDYRINIEAIRPMSVHSVPGTIIR